MLHKSSSFKNILSTYIEKLLYLLSYKPRWGPESSSFISLRKNSTSPLLRILRKSKNFSAQGIISSRHKSTLPPLAGPPLMNPRQGGKGSAFSAWFMTPCLAGEKSGYNIPQQREPTLLPPAGCPNSPPTPASCGDARAGIPHNCRRPGRCCVHRGQAVVRSSPDCSHAR